MEEPVEDWNFSPLLKERDACGVGFVVDIKGEASFKVICLYCQISIDKPLFSSLICCY